jgi:hypothetical protein
VTLCKRYPVLFLLIFIIIILCDVLLSLSLSLSLKNKEGFGFWRRYGGVFRLWLQLEIAMEKD